MDCIKCDITDLCRLRPLCCWCRA